MPIPRKDTKEFEQEKEFFEDATVEQIKDRAKELKILYTSYLRMMRLAGAHRRDKKIEYPKSKTIENMEQKNDEQLIVNLPKINLLTPKKYTHTEDEEIAVLITSDGHAGKVTKSFNQEIYKNRMHELFETTMRIVNLHRKMYKINKLHILNLGDNVQGENPFQGSKIGTTEMGGRDQVTKLAAPTWNNIICSFAQEFTEVEFDGFKGNHGKDKLAPETSSYDLLLYDIIKAGLNTYPRIKINIHEDFGDIVMINGFRFFCFHGDSIKCSQGVPYFALDKKLKSWYIQFNGFDYAASGHFHKRHCDEIASKFEYFMCGTLVSDDDWALSTLGISSNPSQWIIGVNVHKGVTWRYPITIK